MHFQKEKESSYDEISDQIFKCFLIKFEKDDDNKDMLLSMMLDFITTIDAISAFIQLLSTYKPRNDNIIFKSLAKILSSKHITDEDKFAITSNYKSEKLSFIAKACSIEKKAREEAWNSIVKYNSSNIDYGCVIEGMKAFWEQRDSELLYTHKFMDSMIEVFEENGENYGALFMKYMKPPYKAEV